MKIQVRFASLFMFFATLLLLGQGAAIAGNTVVYNNGKPDGFDGWNIADGYYVDDSFTLLKSSNLTRVDFAVWLFPGDQLTSVQWTIYATQCSVAGRRPLIYSGTVKPVAEGSCGSGCEEEGIALPNLNLPAGTYYLRLQNAATNGGDPVFWAESGGPSTAYDSSAVGTIPSESFDVVDPPLGDATPASGSETQPATIGLIGSGAVGVGAILRRLASL